ncbi:MAG TPA: hypothetical protein PKA64_04830 [Myxococcota bacterium]|nr:hypothetical protein [Myxococcota bacterium]
MSNHVTPGLITGTSSEYLGSRPLRRIFRERSVVFVLGPPRSGKSAVARRIVEAPDRAALELDGPRLGEELVRCARHRRWSEGILAAGGLILDGPENLARRPGGLAFVVALLLERERRGLKTVVCQGRGDGSIEALLGSLPAGTAVVLGLRFPNSRSGRLRFARRVCDQMGLDRGAALGTDLIDPWGYAEVIAALSQGRAVGGAEPSPGSAV